MKNTFSILRCRIAISFLVAIFLLGCENSLEKIEEVTSNEIEPDEIGRGVLITHTDSGYTKLTLSSDEYKRYLGENPYTEFTKGVNVKFYNKQGQVYSRIKANYAINYINKKMMEAKDDVVVVNEDNEQLNTEHLIWLREEKKLVSDVFVKITTPDEVIYGDGLDAAEDFSSYKIRNIKGIIKVKDK